MKLPLYQVDAFTGRLFAGNPAAVCVLERWLADATMQAIAAENNLSETAFLVPQAADFGLRWFTPTVEVDLCGHATLASGKVIFERVRPASASLRFHTRSGVLGVARKGDWLELDFPARPAVPCDPPPGLLETAVAGDLLDHSGVGVRRGRAGRPRGPARKGVPPTGGRRPRRPARPDRPRDEGKSVRDYLVVYGSEAEVARLRPDFAPLAALGSAGVIVTAEGDEADFVSRFFAPGSGIDEDPVTGSAHCVLAPAWRNAARPGISTFVLNPSASR